MINYLYYKLYRAAKVSSYKEIAEFTAAIFFGTLIASNVFVINGLFSKLDILPILFRNKGDIILFGCLCMLFAIAYFFYKKRYKQIINNYSRESEKQRKLGNLFVGIYVAFSFLMLFVVALYKPN